MLLAVYVPLTVLSLPRVLATLRFRPISLWFSLFLGTAILSALITTADFGWSAAAYASVRYFLTVPLVFVAYAFIDSESKMRRVLRAYVIFVTFALLTIPLQYVTGPISWFAEPSERANLIRYGSLLGSLTGAGSVVPFVLLIALLLEWKTSTKLIILGSILVSTVLSLQKAAILGIGLAIGTYFLLTGVKKVKQLVFAIVTLVIVAFGLNLAFANWSVWQNATSYVAATLMLTSDSSGLGGDVTIVDSIIGRLTSLPAASLADLVSVRGIWGYFTGGGFAMVGSALMRPDESPFIMAHNGYVDLLLIGGVVHLVAVVMLFLENLLESLRIRSDNLKRQIPADIPTIFVGIMIVSLVSLLFGGGLTFQPNTSAVIWLMVGYNWRVQNRVSLPRGIRLSDQMSDTAKAMSRSVHVG